LPPTTVTRHLLYSFNCISIPINVITPFNVKPEAIDLLRYWKRIHWKDHQIYQIMLHSNVANSCPKCT